MAIQRMFGRRPEQHTRRSSASGVLSWTSACRTTSRCRSGYCLKRCCGTCSCSVCVSMAATPCGPHNDLLVLQVLVDIMHDSEGSSAAGGGAAEALLPQVTSPAVSDPAHRSRL